MKTAIVTGGTRGIGLEVCRLLLQKGYAVTATYSRGEEDARRVRALLPEARFARADVSDERAVADLFANTPAPDILVNNAGIALFSQVQDTSLGDWERVMSVNAGGVFLCCKYAAKKMIPRGKGAIVNVASIWGQTGGSCESAYSASKGAVIGKGGRGRGSRRVFGGERLYYGADARRKRRHADLIACIHSNRRLLAFCLSP